mgnify:CR=1 FL=1
MGAAMACGLYEAAFSTLARAIVGQQISVKAAQSVWDRVVGEVGEERLDRVVKVAEHGAALHFQ